MLSALVIAVLSAVYASLSERYMVDHIVAREATVSQEFVQSLADIENPAPHFSPAPSRLINPASQKFFGHVARMPGVLRANAYAADQTVVWSSDPSVIGLHLGSNDDLEKALAGDLAFELESMSRAAEDQKPEHNLLPVGVQHFIEIYLPVRDRVGYVIGVVELYKSPQALDAVLHRTKWLAWIGAGLSGLALFCSLYWLVRRASRLIESQQRQLVESEKLTAIGEMASAVAHSIRNPLAAIRSSAELALATNDTVLHAEAASDIVSEADRLECRVREMLTYAQAEGIGTERIDLVREAEDLVAGMRSYLVREAIEVDIDAPARSAFVRGDATLLRQALGNVLTNAVESMHEGGALTIVIKRDARELSVRVQDTGEGLTSDELLDVFRPFYTSKVRGLGLGLPLAHRIVGRHGGRLSIDSSKGVGTEVTLVLPSSA
ncbi:MAG: HAMP domain-containing histidine kinase [Gammaproteobacteria bacterium]|nr:HAMP domain-containing histidine kinase [Gammaproteobacteria bacterium]